MESQDLMIDPEPILMPGLPNDLAISCLARLPRSLHPLAQCVSRAWRDALHPSAVDALRRRMSIIENWIFLVVWSQNQSTTSAWYLMDPLLLRRCAIPAPPLTAVLNKAQNLDCAGEPLGIIAADTQVLITGVKAYERGRMRRRDVEEVFCFDVTARQWGSSVPPMIVDRNGYACGTLDGFVYVAGGILDFEHQWRAIKSAERFNMRSRQWEKLPDMKEVRGGCTGVVLNGCFFVIGGHYQTETRSRPTQNSAEFWDPKTGEWTLVPEMWPLDMHHGRDTRVEVVVVGGQLYGLRELGLPEIMWYDQENKRWTSLGCFPSDRSENATTFYRLTAVADQLWVTRTDLRDDNATLMLATTPAQQPLSWRLLPFSFPKPFSTHAVVSV